MCSRCCAHPRSPRDGRRGRRARAAPRRGLRSGRTDDSRAAGRHARPADRHRLLPPSGEPRPRAKSVRLGPPDRRRVPVRLRAGGPRRRIGVPRAERERDAPPVPPAGDPPGPPDLLPRRVDPRRRRLDGGGPSDASRRVHDRRPADGVGGQRRDEPNPDVAPRLVPAPVGRPGGGRRERRGGFLRSGRRVSARPAVGADGRHPLRSRRPGSPLRRRSDRIGGRLRRGGRPLRSPDPFRISDAFVRPHPRSGLPPVRARSSPVTRSGSAPTRAGE
jgi:hypothetical protein